MPDSSAKFEVLERNENTAVAYFTSLLDCFHLIDCIRENSDKLLFLQLCNGLIYKRINHASGNELQEQQALDAKGADDTADHSCLHQSHKCH